jgi:hypothetical protein
VVDFFKIILLVSIIFLLSLNACDIINPSEQVPSFITVDTIKLKTTSPQQGSQIHAITDCWVYVNNKLIGIFEVPFKIPVLESGMQEIQIEPGIKNSGSDSKREVYPLMKGWYLTENFSEGAVLKLEPEFEYRNVVFDLVEDFEDIGIEFETSLNSDTTIQIISGPEAQEGKSMYFALDNERRKFECLTSKLYEIPKNGRAFLEISFKGNGYFNFGIFSVENVGTGLSEVRKNVYTFKPKEDWTTIYIDLNYYVTNAKGTSFRLFFTSVRPEDSSNDKTEIFIDNIKLTYLLNQ